MPGLTTDKGAVQTQVVLLPGGRARRADMCTQLLHSRSYAGLGVEIVILQIFYFRGGHGHV